MREITVDKNLIAFCGLYCGACSRYLNEKCPGCHENQKATWCKVRTCNMENKYASCADCRQVVLSECKDLNNFVARIFGFIFRSDRKACLERIKAVGYDAFSREMAEAKMSTIRRK